jgi:hypothetical protein
VHEVLVGTVRVLGGADVSRGDDQMTVVLYVIAAIVSAPFYLARMIWRAIRP